MTVNEIAAGDVVTHRESGRQGTVKAVVDTGADWLADPGSGPRIRWAMVWWQDEDRPAVETIGNLDRQQ